VSERTFTGADQKFYEWFHVSGEHGGSVSVEFQRRIFMAGWLSAQEAGSSDE
jgi:hypothetical protein